MKFAVVLVVALCHVAVISAYECGGCSLDGKWRSVNRITNADDDDIMLQAFDGQVEWREESFQFQNDLERYRNDLNNETAQVEARTSCKEAIPDRIYNFRFEREIDDMDFEVQTYIYKGFKPAEKKWDNYCDDLVNDNQGNQALLYVSSKGSKTYDDLKGAWQRKAIGKIELTGGSTCNVRFRPRKLVQKCLMKNQGNRYPTEIFCNNNQKGLNSITEEHAYGGAHTHARYGCQQYTWDSDTNDDNIAEGNKCGTMYFVNSYSGQNTFKLGVLPQSGTGSIALANGVVSVDTPADLCERKVKSTGWNNMAKPSDHGCQ